MWGWLIIVAGLIGSSFLAIYLRMRWGRDALQEMSEKLELDAHDAVIRSQGQPWFLP
jgi:uncharacterized membrane protein YdjX (TVP38/TMEM64 family)